MVIHYVSEAKFDRRIQYFHSTHCNTILSIAVVDVFRSLLSSAVYFVLKNSEGLAVAYYVQDEIYIRGEKKGE